MSKYTTELRFICENLAGFKESQDGNTVLQVINVARPKIFNFDYPIYSQNYKSTLETKILLHFYTREIGLETYGLWQLKLMTKMNEIMPFYNKMYEAIASNINLLADVDYLDSFSGNKNRNDSTINTRTEEGGYTKNLTRTGSDTTHSEGTSENINKYSATPQGGLEGLLNGDYLTDANVTNASGTNTDTVTHETSDTETLNRDGKDNSTGTFTGNEKQDDMRHVVGLRGGKTYAEIFREYQEKMVNIDLAVMNELEELFMQVW